jgi:hypothetical protein
MKHKLTKLTLITLLLVAHTSAFVRPTSAEIIENSWETIPILVYEDCTGEWLEGTVKVHLIWILNAGKVDSIHTNVKGTAVGLTSGNRYVFHNNYKDDFTNYFCGGIATARAHARWISQGKLPNRDAEFRITYEFDDDCNPLPPTVEVVDFRCK